jgi:hypothetical protein
LGGCLLAPLAMAADVFRLLQVATKGNHLPQEKIVMKRSEVSDPFEKNPNDELVVMKTRRHLRADGGSIRRAYAKCSTALDYRYVGWVFDDDVDSCMICGDYFTLFRRRHHCRVCGNLICGSCSTGTVRIKEIQSDEKMRACDNCYIGQEEVSIKPLEGFVFNSSLSSRTGQPIRPLTSASTASQNNLISATNIHSKQMIKLRNQVYRLQVLVLIVYVALYIIVLQINK